MSQEEKGSKRKSEENLEKHEAQKDGVEEKTSAEEAETPTISAKKKKSKKSKHGEGEAASNVAKKNQDSATEKVPAQDDENQAEAPKKKKSKKTKQVEVEQIGAKDVKGARQVWEPGEEMAKFAEVLSGNAEMRLRLLLGKTSTGDLDSTSIEDKEDKFTRRAALIEKLERD